MQTPEPPHVCLLASYVMHSFCESSTCIDPLNIADAFFRHPCSSTCDVLCYSFELVEAEARPKPLPREASSQTMAPSRLASDECLHITESFGPPAVRSCFFGKGCFLHHQSIHYLLGELRHLFQQHFPRIILAYTRDAIGEMADEQRTEISSRVDVGEVDMSDQVRENLFMLVGEGALAEDGAQMTLGDVVEGGHEVLLTHDEGIDIDICSRRGLRGMPEIGDDPFVAVKVLEEALDRLRPALV